jgi:glycosyltransferase involved in cell wall biosynthesis
MNSSETLHQNGQGSTTKLRVLLVGGSADKPGGVEAFCSRAKQALANDDSVIVEHLTTSTAFFRPSALPRLIGEMGRLIGYRRWSPDVVWFQWVNVVDLAFLVLARLCGYRVVVTPHLGANWRSQRNPVLRRLGSLLMRLTNRFALLSPTQALELSLPESVPSGMIRTFLPQEMWAANGQQSETATGTLRLIHSARLSAGKGTFLFLDVCAGLKQAGVPFEAALAGGADDQTMAEIQHRIAALGLHGNVQCLGWLGTDAMMARLRKSDVLVHLSIMDSYPLIVLESLASGAFPICLDLAGARHMTQAYDGAVVPEGTAVAGTVAFLLATPAETLRDRAKAASAKVRADHAWQNAAAALKAGLS